MKIHPAAQGTLEWLTARAGVVTASEFDQIVTTDFNPRTGDMPKSYLARKAAEKWLGSPLSGYQSIDMEIGQILEERAIPFFEMETGQTIQRVGLVTDDAGDVGCSPDGLIGDNSGIELKCPRPDTHVNYLLRGVVPKDYVAQVHGGMFVTGRPQWVFMSYCRGFPALILTVQRDNKIMDLLETAIGDFLVNLEAAMSKLREINGGPPRRSTFKPNPQPQPFVSEIPS